MPEFNLAEHYLKKMGFATTKKEAKLTPNRGQFAAATEVLEATELKSITKADIEERTLKANKELHRIAEENSDDVEETKKLADKITEHATKAMTALSKTDNDYLIKNKFAVQSLEAVIVADGTRPSYLIQDGKVNKGSGAASEWIAGLDRSGPDLVDPIASVGRIDLNGTHQGTGFLIAENIIATNHHVLEIISMQIDGQRKILEGATIGFGHEYRREPGPDMKISKAIFYQSFNFNGKASHKHLDLVLLQIDPTPAGVKVPKPFVIDPNKFWATEKQSIYTIGYPAEPSNLDAATLTQIFFKDTFRCKRLSPGRILKSALADWSTSYDATTLTGNSGSVLVVTDNVKAAVAIHYGGQNKIDPAANWGHILGKTLDAKNSINAMALREILEQNSVEFLDEN